MNNLPVIVPQAKWVDGDPPAIEHLTKALIIIHASWSGYSIINASKILHDLVHFQAPLPDIFILDIDKLNLEYIKGLLGGRLAHGYAESVWVENGEVVKMYKGREEPGAFTEFIKGRL